MTRPTKVYGGSDFRRGTQMRVIVRARSFAAASRAVEAAGLFKPRRDYWSTSGNPRELAATEGREGEVLWRPLDAWDGEYTAVEK